jgi:glycosyltransferase involved in cell wall biosynthesis
MDLAVVSSDARGGFHYSPLKLREYAACGLPVVAPAEGELAGLTEAGFVHLHPPGDGERLAEAIDALAADGELRRHAGKTARRHALAHWTWEAQLDRVIERLV